LSGTNVAAAQRQVFPEPNVDHPAEFLCSPGNRLLQGLLRKCAGLSEALERRSVDAGVELYREGEPIDEFYFPTCGVVSIVVRLREGGTADVQTVGNEGLVGLPAWLGLDVSLDTVVQQAPGEMVRVAVDRFHALVDPSEHARGLLNSYVAYSFRFSSQTCVCNTHHSVTQRLCRWMLTSADRAGSTELALSQAMLADMIGVRRQSVSEVLVELHRAGSVQQRRNRIRILDRGHLERLSCECYRTTRELYARLVEPRL
jgi:CRP-like cAMP-binding protein